jgi:putative hydrolase of the HAD superfamily
MPINAVAFDVDGTLYPNSSMYLRSIPFAITHPRLVVAYRRVRHEVRRRRPIHDLQVLERELLAEQLGITAAEAGRLIDVQIHEEWEATLNRVRLYPHVRSTILHLRELGLRIAVSSDFPVERKLKRLGVHDLFDCMLWSEQSGYLKPHPEPFHALAECIGLPPEEILYVGNSYEYDVEGAKAVGMSAAHIRLFPVRNSIADLTFIDYRHLGEWVDRQLREENRPPN